MNMADNLAGLSTAPLTSLWYGLHLAAPSSDDQGGNEATYAGYARTAVLRSTSSPAFTVTAASSAGAGAKMTPNAAISFPEATGATTAQTATYFSIGTSSAATGKIVLSGAMSPSIAISNGVTPRLTTASTIVLT
jgi:hypothetical protein